MTKPVEQELARDDMQLGNIELEPTWLSETKGDQCWSSDWRISEPARGSNCASHCAVMPQIALCRSSRGYIAGPGVVELGPNMTRCTISNGMYAGRCGQLTETAGLSVGAI